MFTQTIAHLSNDIDISYSDSGPVSGSSQYTTIIFIHGTGINGHVFEGLHDLAASRKLRTIALNRRDHPGSTPFTDDELDDIKQGRTSFIHAFSLQMVEFICHVANELKVPHATPAYPTAGIVVVGWSHGGAVALWTLAHPTGVSASQGGTLEKYLNKVIIYDSAVQTLGWKVPKTEPVGDEPKNMEEYLEQLPLFLTSYFDHPADWNGDPDLLDRRNTADKPEPKPTWYRWTKEQQARCMTWESLGRSELLMYAEPMLTTMGEATQRALFDEDIISTFCPRVTFGLLSTGRPLWPCRLGPHVLQEAYKELTSKGVGLRSLKVVHLPDANHFAHNDYPDDFLDALQTLIEPSGE